MSTILLKCSRGTIYLWDGFEKTFLSYPIIMMTRSYNGMLMHTNSLIIIFICLYFDLNSMFYYAGILEHTYFIYLKIYFSQISMGRMCPYSTYHCWWFPVQSIPLYSWGLSVLTCLYKHLCQASLEKSKQVGGCLLL
jgi:hypothetical protein